MLTARRGLGAIPENIMPKHIIIASELPSQPPLYFSGYKDDGDLFDTLWTFDYWQARWIDAPEASVETALLARLYPSYRLQSYPLDQVGTSKAG